MRRMETLDTLNTLIAIEKLIWPLSLGLIAYLGWLFRLEATGKGNRRDIDRVEKNNQRDIERLEKRIERVEDRK